MKELTYESLISELFPRLTGGIRWGLERTRELLASVDNPHEKFRTIHVAGTNGKGSVAASLASMLESAGHKTGLYSSPHLCTFRERIQIDGAAISRDDLVSAAADLWPKIQELAPSFFEATTAIGFHALARAGVDVAVIEVGLGGRLDSTNVITPELSIITNIALDHAEYLGSTLDSVAREKAGIIKKGVPVLTAERGDVALGEFRARASTAGAALHILAPNEPQAISFDTHGTSFHYAGREWQTPLIGAHQAVNAALAIEAAHLLHGDLAVRGESVQAGLARVYWPGRMQIEQIDSQHWVFDVAHNVAGVHALVDCISALALPRPLVVLIGILGDKDWNAMLPPLFGVADRVVLTRPPTAPANRSWDPERVLQAQPSAKAEVQDDFSAALARAASLAESGTVLVTGSFHTVGDALIALDRAPFGAD